ncbi:hypothetical protein TNCV_276401 [Trichonephila clavipes]|nr:hypothetical protein TNCV_276401 [Trichonephila clavipes]
MLTTDSRPNRPQGRIASAAKECCVFFLGSGGTNLLYELPKPGETVNTDRYKQQLLNLNDAVLEKPTRGLLATDHVILNHGQLTWTTPELLQINSSTEEVNLSTRWVIEETSSGRRFKELPQYPRDDRVSQQRLAATQRTQGNTNNNGEENEGSSRPLETNSSSLGIKSHHYLKKLS